ncbi:GNAT family N-acetyltransferase [Ornithinimicrobium sp. F0845]|uniref:GNAT family N-acetyltransferase n=1 Tax=Ornithinimicrobium sp. F0845 TaxID=2926412 RepID=UPI001FF4C338|nr:GNAT family N-acetyltransferase [Ornithinimicrobium sp. F0845]MCK0112783.1 GNAT family N-acetyltransferase [Ornithinimicrobium sp. F0845]
MEVAVVTTSEGLADLRTEWEQLESHPSTPYYVTHRFVTAWWESFGQLPDHRLHIVTVRQDGRLVGIAPFAVRPGRRHRRTVPVLGWASHGDYLSLLYGEDGATPKTITSLVMTEVTRLVDEREVSYVDLRGIPSESSFAWCLRKSQQHHPHLAFDIENPYLDLSQGYTVPSHARKRRNKLHRERDVSFTVFHGNEHDILERLAAVHRAEKEHLIEQGRQERHSLFEDPQRLEHIRTIFIDTDDALTFALVEGGDPSTGRLVGYFTVLRHAGRLLSWNTGYLPDYETYSLGTVLQLEILEYLDEHDPGRELAREFDFGAGTYPWKYEWTSSLRATYRLLIKAPAKPWMAWAERTVRRVRRLDDATG